MDVIGCIIGCMLNIETIKITQEILQLIAEIDEFKGAWRLLSMLAPERLLALRRVATIESIGSSTRIEGSKLSNTEIERLLSNLQINTFDTRDEEEVAGYASVMELIFQSWNEISLTENYIQQLHSHLLKYSQKDEHHRGNYKKTSNSVAAYDEEGKQIGIVFETATPFDTPYKMTELIETINNALAEKTIHPLLIVAIFVVIFLEIHPFQDGNGRLSRVISTLLLLKTGYAYVPYSSLESIIEQSKDAYYLALRQTQSSVRTEIPDWQPWILFLLRSLQKQTRLLSQKIEREKLILETLPDISIQIIEHIQAHGRVTIGEMVKLTGKSRNTLKEHFKILSEKKYIKLHGAGRGAWYGNG